MKQLLDRLGSGEGLWVMALIALGAISALLWAHRLAGAEFVSSFSMWVGAVFGSAAIAAYRDWNKPNDPPKA